MKRIIHPSLVAVLFFAYALRTTAETVLFTNGPVNYTITVPTNYVLAIRYSAVRTSSGTGSVRVTKDAKVVSLYNGFYVTDGLRNFFIAGPASWDISGTVTNSYGTFTNGIITYSLLPAQGLQTVVVEAGKTNTISVPTGKTMVIVSALGVSNMAMRRGDVIKWIDMVTFASPLEIDGAVDFDFVGFSPGNSSGYLSGGVITYFFADSIAALPNGTVKTSGPSVLIVEKSTNLADWSPAYVVFKGGDPQSFYRLKAAQ